VRAALRKVPRTFAGAAAGVWFGLLRPRAAGERAQAPATTAAAAEIPAACREWERVACACAHQAVRGAHCGAAREHLRALERGARPPVDCAAQARSARQLCPDGPSAPGAPATERRSTGIEECDAFVHHACTCGAPGDERDERCRRANQIATEEALRALERSPRCDRELAEARRACALP